MKRARPVVVTKVRQGQSLAALQKPGVPYKGANLVAQRAESSKKNARKASTAKKVVK